MKYNFVQQYDDEMRTAGAVRPKVVTAINRDVMENMYLVDMQVLEWQDEMRSVDDVKAYNDSILGLEGFTRDDVAKGLIPAYLEPKLWKETSVEEYQTRIDDTLQDFYSHVSHVDSVLSDACRKSLGPGYQEYLDEMRARRAEKTVESERKLPCDGQFDDDKQGDSNLYGPRHQDGGWYFDEYH